MISFCVVLSKVAKPNKVQNGMAELQGRMAGQNCRAELQGRTAGQNCRAELQGRTAGQNCRESCRAELQCRIAVQNCTLLSLMLILVSGSSVVGRTYNLRLRSTPAATDTPGENSLKS
jgi:hypothetical protein